MHRLSDGLRWIRGRAGRLPWPLRGALLGAGLMLAVLLGSLAAVPAVLHGSPHRWTDAASGFGRLAPAFAAFGLLPGLAFGIAVSRTRRLGWAGDAAVWFATVQALILALVLLHPFEPRPGLLLEVRFWATSLLVSAGMALLNAGVPALRARIGGTRGT